MGWYCCVKGDGLEHICGANLTASTSDFVASSLSRMVVSVRDQMVVSGVEWYRSCSMFVVGSYR